MGRKPLAKGRLGRDQPRVVRRLNHMVKLLVTGGLGFIGSNYIQDRINRFPESSIINVDSMSYGSNPRNLASLEGNLRYRFEKCDIRNTEQITKLVKQVDLIVHFAAETHVDRSIAKPSAFLESNVIGTHSLLEASRKADVRRFVHVSTDEVYGSAPRDESFDENSILNPSSPYSASKAAADMFVISYHKTYGLPIVILRCTNNFGTNQFPEKFIPKAIIRSLLGKDIPIYGNGLQIRDWIYVKDFCGAINLAIEHGSPGTVYNVSAGNELANLEVVKKVLAILNKSTDIIHFVEDRPGHDLRYSLNSSKIRNTLGWKPHLEFEDALRVTVDWYQANENWWKPLLNDKILSPTPWKESW
jgi:dTDP-glucose 4,6-dehydratase